jgi:hypothetical protein
MLPAVRPGNDTRLRASGLANLAGYLVACDDLSGATEAAYEAIENLVREPDHYLVTAALEHLALVDALRGRLQQAARFASYADSAFEKTGTKRGFTERATHERLAVLLDAKLTPEDRSKLSAEGAALTPEAAVALALERNTRST